MQTKTLFVSVVTAMLTLAGTVQANVFSMGAGLTSLVTVPVGDPGNAADMRYNLAPPWGRPEGYGAVAYAYNIGKYEVTAGQYAEFLNAVAATDTYGLYNTYMDADVPYGYGYSYGCNIKRAGSPGTYTYSVPPDWANRPVNYVSWGDAARFANWLHNGQPTGEPAQGGAATEDGAYHLTYYSNPTKNDMALLAVTRKANWRWAIPTEDEWYKAAYYVGSSINAGYFDYPTRSDSLPSGVLGVPIDPGNNATYNGSFGDLTIGSPYYRTEVGDHESSDSPYGTFDQGGNIWEWNEGILHSDSRGVRGGSFDVQDNTMRAEDRSAFGYTWSESYTIGFRVSEVPEPATLSLLALGGLAFLTRRWYAG